MSIEPIRIRDQGVPLTVQTWMLPVHADGIHDFLIVVFDQRGAKKMARPTVPLMTAHSRMASCVACKREPLTDKGSRLFL